MQRTTVRNKADVSPLDLINRQFRAPAPSVLWVSDSTYVSTWFGFVYVAFVIDVFARRIVGWRVSRTAHSDFVLDALEQALHQLDHRAAEVLFIKATAAANMSRLNIPSDWRRPELSRPSAA